MIWNKSPLVNIVTIEDPIDRQIDYATQIQVDANMGRTHATLLRGVLRQDPDIILVGEMRDTESASLALEAATTGHLVLSTLHDRRALESVTRLRSLNVESYLIGASLRGVISQCLLGINCPDCQQTISDPANDEEVKELFVLNILSPDDDPSVLRRSPGCEGCRKMGIKGRVAAFEIFVPSDATLRLIAGGKLIADIKSKLAPDELMPMEGYVRRLLLDGVVSPKEALDIFPHV